MEAEGNKPGALGGQFKSKYNPNHEKVRAEDDTSETAQMARLNTSAEEGPCQQRLVEWLNAGKMTPAEHPKSATSLRRASC